MSVTDAKRPIIGGKPYHIMIGPEDVSRYVLLPGDPGRVPRIAKFWDEYKPVGAHREYVTYKGRYKGVPITAISTGIGGPSTAIAIEELLVLGADTFIRVGTTGAIQPEINVGDIIINIASVRFDGASKAYVVPEYPAVASIDVTLALIAAAESLNVRYHVGISASTDSFYVGQERPGFRGYLPPWFKGLIDFLKCVKVLNFEMENATIFTLAQIYGARAGSVCAVLANRIRDEFVADAGVDDAIRVANEAVYILSQWDELSKAEGSFYRALRLWFKK